VPTPKGDHLISLVVNRTNKYRCSRLIFWKSKLQIQVTQAYHRNGGMFLRKEVFWLSGSYEPIIENASENNFKMSKKSKINFTCTSGHSRFPHKFLTKKNILCGIGKKTKICP
jgi:hypothetical protein